MEDMEKKILEHDFSIQSLAKAMKELAETTKDSNQKLSNIEKSLNKQELILEKLANLEISSKDSINRVHKRIDIIEKEVEIYKKRGDEGGCTALKLLAEKEKTFDTKLEANVKSNQHRIEKLENSVTWVVRSIIGSLLAGAIGFIFYMAKG